MILSEEYRSTHRKTCPSDTESHEKSTKTGCSSYRLGQPLNSQGKQTGVASTAACLVHRSLRPKNYVISPKSIDVNIL